MRKFIVFLAVLCSFVFGESENFKKGKAVYDTWCISCHGVKMPGTNALAILYKGTDISPLLTERKDMSKEMIWFFVRNGKHSMPFFRKTEINDEELKNLSEYLTK